MTQTIVLLSAVGLCLVWLLVSVLLLPVALAGAGLRGIFAIAQILRNFVARWQKSARMGGFR